MPTAELPVSFSSRVSEWQAVVIPNMSLLPPQHARTPGDVGRGGSLEESGRGDGLKSPREFPQSPEFHHRQVSLVFLVEGQHRITFVFGSTTEWRLTTCKEDFLTGIEIQSANFSHRR